MKLFFRRYLKGHNHESLLVREQQLFMEKLKNLSASVSQNDVSALSDKEPDSETLAEDKLPNSL